MYLMKNSTFLTTFTLRILNQKRLVGSDSTIILTGSASIECAKNIQNFESYFNGQSDIDLIIVVDNDVLFLNELFSESVCKSFYNDSINVLNFTYQYGEKRNAINIKYIKPNTLNKFMCLKDIHFKSYRKTSLKSKKDFMKCYGFFDSMNFSYTEEAISDYFILNYDITMKEKYYLTDIASMVLFGTIIFGGELTYSIKKFNFFFYLLLDISDDELYNLFGYYLYEKKSIKDSELRFLLKKFTEINIESRLIFLKENGLISIIHGQIKENSQLATICWARSDPKPVFKFMNKISMCISSKKFILLVDDFCPKILYNRTDIEQKIINQKYLDAYPKCQIYFSSDIFNITLSKNFMKEFVNIMKKINLNYYIKFLPEKKRNNLTNANLGEFVHTFFELFLLTYAKDFLNIDTIIFGAFSQNVMFMFNEFFDKNSTLNYIVIPVITNEIIKRFGEIY